MRWTNIFRGFAMGITELIPGVSSGTIALLLGVYEQLLSSIKGLLGKSYRKSLQFLIPLVIGMGVSLLTLSSVMTYLLETHPIPTQMAFVGLVIGVLPMLWRLSRVRETFKAPHIIMFIIALALLIGMSFITPEEVAHSPEVTMMLLIKLFFAGILAAMTLLLPGISGSLVLLILGYYFLVVSSISELTSFNFAVLPILIAVGLGILVGLYVGSVVIMYLFTHFKYMTYAGVMGLVLGSISSIYPGLPTSPTMWIVTIITFIVGFLISFLLGLVGEKEATSEEAK